MNPGKGGFGPRNRQQVTWVDVPCKGYGCIKLAMDYVDCNKAALKNWERSQMNHKRSLQVIKLQPALVDNRPPATFNAVYYKAEAKRFYQAEREKAIRTENQKLMTKLIEISGGKGRFSATPRTGHSLNSPRRRLEANRLQSENLALATRLSTRGSHFSTTQWHSAYQQSRKYKDLISKVHLTPGVRRVRQHSSESWRGHLSPTGL